MSSTHTHTWATYTDAITGETVTAVGYTQCRIVAEFHCSDCGRINPMLTDGYTDCCNKTQAFRNCENIHNNQPN